MCVVKAQVQKVIYNLALKQNKTQWRCGVNKYRGGTKYNKKKPNNRDNPNASHPPLSSSSTKGSFSFTVA